jgi:hypothetical protein
MESGEYEAFHKHFRAPSVVAKKAQKAWKKSNEAGEEARRKISPEQLKCFEDLAAKVFDFFEEFTGKAVNRHAMEAHLFKYFDEDFEPEDCIAYLKQQKKEDYYLENPQLFTIQKLFPLDDEKRFNMVWDFLAFFKAGRIRGTKEIRSNERSHLEQCGHVVFTEDFRKDLTCHECFAEKNIEAIINEPYAALKHLPEDQKELRELATWFCRNPAVDLTLADYAMRTAPKRKAIMDALGKKCDPFAVIQAVKSF